MVITRRTTDLRLAQARSVSRADRDHIHPVVGTAAHRLPFGADAATSFMAGDRSRFDKPVGEAANSRSFGFPDTKAPFADHRKAQLFGQFTELRLWRPSDDIGELTHDSGKIVFHLLVSQT